MKQPATLTAASPGRAVPVGALSRVLLGGTAVLGTLAFTWPLFIDPGSALAADTTAPLVLAGILPLLLGLVVVQLTNAELDVKALSMLGVLTAMGAVARPLGAGTAGVELVFFLILLAGRVFGAGFGFVLGNTTLFASALITGGVGAWLPYQMLAAGFMGLGAGLLPHARGRAESCLLAGYGVLASFGYGMAMDLAFWPFVVGRGAGGFDPDLGPIANLHRFLVVNLATGMGWNLGRAVTNAVLVGVLGSPVLRVLRRANRRAGFVAADNRPGHRR